LLGCTKARPRNIYSMPWPFAGDGMTVRDPPPLSQTSLRHGRAWPGHPRLPQAQRQRKAWMPGTRPGMTDFSDFRS